MIKRNNHELLKDIGFTKKKAWYLFSYVFFCSCIGLGVFVYLAVQSFNLAVNETKDKLSKSITDVTAIYTDKAPHSDVVISRKALNLAIPEKELGPKDLALIEKVPLAKVKGQRKNIDRDVYAIRFVDVEEKKDSKNDKK